MGPRNGFALVEVMVGSIILLFTAAAVFALLLSISSSTKAGQARYEVSQEAAKLREHLKSYVTEDLAVLENAPGAPPWHLPEDSSCASCWALAPGTHDATSLIAQSLRDRYGATMKYAVTAEDYKGRKVSHVKISVDWEVP